MKALSFKQPWGWLVFHGKDIDNRKWRTNYRGRIIVHASKSWDNGGMRWLLEHKEILHSEVWMSEMMAICASGKMPYGALIGEVDIVDCVVDSCSPWFFGKYGFVLSNPVLYEKPIPYKGSLGLFNIRTTP
jgi:hypothetical protein